MSRKVTVEISTKVTMIVDEGVEIADVINEMEYSFDDNTGSATVEDTEILDYNVTDSH